MLRLLGWPACDGGSPIGTGARQVGCAKWAQDFFALHKRLE
jgi:hypothetical protein